MKYFLILFLFHFTLARYVPVFINFSGHRTARQDFIGNWIQSSEWFPIEINVPDVVTALSNGLTTGFLNFSDTFGSWIQNLPFFNRFVNTPYVPKHHEKTKLVLLVPLKHQHYHNKGDDDYDDNLLPAYP